MHWHRFETLQHASRVIGDWVSFYNTREATPGIGSYVQGLRASTKIYIALHAALIGAIVVIASSSS